MADVAVLEGGLPDVLVVLPLSLVPSQISPVSEENPPPNLLPPTPASPFGIRWVAKDHVTVASALALCWAAWVVLGAGLLQPWGHRGAAGPALLGRALSHFQVSAV